MTYQKSMSMKSCAIFLLNFILPLCAFAQSPVWTEDIEAAWKRALNENKMLFVCVTTRSLSQLEKDSAFKKNFDDSVVYLCIPAAYEKKYDAIFSISKKFYAEHKKFIDTYGIIRHSICLVDPRSNEITKIHWYYKFSSTGIKKLKEKMCSKKTVDKNSDQDLSLLNLRGHQSDFKRAYQYAKQKGLGLILFGVCATSFEKYDNSFLLYNKGGLGDALFVFYPATDKYIPIEAGINLEREIELAMEELKNPSYPTYSLDDKAPLSSSGIAYNFDSAVRTACKQNKLILIEVLRKSADDSKRSTSNKYGQTELSGFANKNKAILLRIEGIFCEELDGFIIQDKQHSKVMGAKVVKYAIPLLYDPVSKKYGELPIFADANTFKQEFEILAAELKNPYSTRTKKLGQESNAPKVEEGTNDLGAAKADVHNAENASNKQKLLRRELEEDGDGFTDKSIAAFQYAQENKLWVLLFPEYVLKDFLYLKDIDYIKENFVLVKAKDQRGHVYFSANTAYLFDSENKNYIPVECSTSFVENLKTAVAELKDPRYPRVKYSEEEAASASPLSNNIFDEFYSAEKTAKSKGKLLYIQVCETLENKAEPHILGLDLFLLRVKASHLYTEGDGMVSNYHVIPDKFLSKMQTILFPKQASESSAEDVLFDPNSCKYAMVPTWDESTPTEKFLNEIEISAAEFKNPYSTKTKYFWGDAPTDEKSNK